MSADLRELWSSAGGNVPDHWEFKTIEELLEHSKSISVGVMYPGSNSEGGIPLIKVSDVKNGAIASQPEFCVSKAVDEEYKRTRLNGTELLITLVGNPGDCVVATNEMAGWNAARALAVLRLKNIELRAWLRYVLLSKPAKHLIEARLNTTVQKTLNLKDIRELGVPIPPKKERESITDVIDAIETKMLLNRQTNQTLEQIAQAIFKSWFVDFEPVKAKMAALEAGGSEDDALLAAMQAIAGSALFATDVADADAQTQLARLQTEHPEQYATLRATAELFPSAMQESELGEIPEGWEAKRVGKYLDTISKTYPLKKVKEVVFLNTGDIKEGRFLHANKSLTEGLPGQAKKSIKKHDILYSEIRPQNKRYAYVDFEADDYVVSTKLMVLRSSGEVDSRFLYFLLTQKDSIDYLQMMAESRSGTFPQITFDVLEKINFLGPVDNKLLNYFANFFLLPFMTNSFEIVQQNKNLEELRDTLLPKLLSGELSVSAAADQITQAEEAVNVQG